MDKLHQFGSRSGAKGVKGDANRCSKETLESEREEGDRCREFQKEGGEGGLKGAVMIALCIVYRFAGCTKNSKKILTRKKKVWIKEIDMFQL